MNFNWFRLTFICSFFLLSACGGNSGSTNAADGNNAPAQINSHQMGGAIQTELPSLALSVTTIAGIRPGYVDGTGIAARFRYPMSTATDGTYLYVVDSGNNVIRKIAIATGAVTTLAGTAGTSGSADGTGLAARFNYPNGITTDGTNLYVTDCNNCTIRKVVIATGEVSTLAGIAEFSGASTDGIGPAARFGVPMGITTDGVNLFVTEIGSNTVRKIVIATGAVTTVAGSAGTHGSADGIGSSANFDSPNGIATDGTNLYIADSYNSTIRKIHIATGTVTTLAGMAGANGFADGTGPAAAFNSPAGITIAGANLYVADSNQTLRVVNTDTGTVTTLAGSPWAYGSADGIGAAAHFYFPEGLSTDGANLYVADSCNSVIRKIVIATGSVTTLAGCAPMGSNDGVGATASFALPRSVATDGTNLYLADTYNSTIRKIVIATGTVTTFAGSAGVTGHVDGFGTIARFNNPCGITTDGINLYVADSANYCIRRIVIATGVVTTLAGGSFGSEDGVGTGARFNRLLAITTDGTNLYLVDSNSIRKVIIANGEVTTLAGTVETSGSADGIGSVARFQYPEGITTDGTDIFVADTYNYIIRKIRIATGAVSTIAGTEAVCETTDGIGTSAHFSHPVGITTDGTSLYLGDSGTIRKMVLATGTVTTISGSAEGGNVDGIGSLAGFDGSPGLTTDGTRLFIADTYNNTVRSLE